MRQPLGERRYRAKNKAAWDGADPSIHSWLKTERDLTSGRAGKAFGQTAAANQEQSSQVEGGVACQMARTSFAGLSVVHHWLPLADLTARRCPETQHRGDGLLQLRSQCSGLTSCCLYTELAARPPQHGPVPGAAQPSPQEAGGRTGARWANGCVWNRLSGHHKVKRCPGTQQLLGQTRAH